MLVWLVERNGDGTPQWFRRFDGSEDAMPLWTTDPNAAMRFPDLPIARIYAGIMPDGHEATPTEHEFVSTPRESGLDFLESIKAAAQGERRRPRVRIVFGSC